MTALELIESMGWNYDDTETSARRVAEHAVRTMYTEQDIDNNAIHFAEWLTKKHTTTLMLLYEQFKQENQ